MKQLTKPHVDKGRDSCAQIGGAIVDNFGPRKRSTQSVIHPQVLHIRSTRHGDRAKLWK